MSKEIKKIYCGDFETTVYDGQTRTDVWSAGLVELYTEDVTIDGSIEDFFNRVFSFDWNSIIYFHNLKFDGSFILDYLFNVRHFKQSVLFLSDNDYDLDFRKKKDMHNSEVIYSISDRGQWYTITVKYRNHYIEFRDSLKLLPFKLRDIGQAFKTKHQKLDMVYEGVRYPNCPRTAEEDEYQKNDVLVLKEALEFMFEKGHDKLTIGSCCYAEYKKIIGKHDWNILFPKLSDAKLHPAYGSATADEYIRHSYKGGWCYVVKGKECKIYYDGCTADVNSLYPSQMHSDSGNYYPVGKPNWWIGDIPDEAKKPERYYFVRIKTRFYLKEGKLPFIQIKGNPYYKGTEMLETSDIYVKKTGKYYKYLVDKDGNVHDTRVELTLTCTDYELLKEHDNLEDCEVLDGCWFYAMKGIFDEYINKWAKVKMESKGALRTLAKLFLNNLYGKFASNTNSSFKYAITDGDSLMFIDIPQNNKEAGYIPIGSAITSYARNFTIRTAQANYHGVNSRGFIYADTDSIHCDLHPDELVNVPVHPTQFNHWKIESNWDVAWFTRQKTYIEHITHEDLEPIEKPYYNIKCAGMPDKCKRLFELSLEGKQPDKEERFTEKELAFLIDNEGNVIKRDLNSFDKGLVIYGKLMPRRIAGGTLLVPTTFELR